MSGFPYLERMTFPEVGAALSSGTTTVVFACGAVEQHGPHLPMFMDAEHGSRLAIEVARRLGKALVAPTVRVGCSEHHMTFPGTLSLRAETLEAICHDYCVSLARHGFTDIGIIPSHGGNFAPVRDMLPRLQAAVSGNCRVMAFTDLIGMIDMWKRAVGEAGGDVEHVGGHADIAESSVMLTLYPELVHVELAERGYVTDATESVVAKILRDGFRTVSPNGVLGDARGLSADIGEHCVAMVANRIAEHFKAQMAGA